MKHKLYDHEIKYFIHTFESTIIILITIKSTYTIHIFYNILMLRDINPKIVSNNNYTKNTKITSLKRYNSL